MSRERAFVFANGWGSNQYFWQNLQPILASDPNNYYLCDFGYFKNGKKNSIESLDSFIDYHRAKGTQIVGIGHSLGFSKLLSMNFELDYYLGLQTFISFLGNNNSMAKYFLDSYKAKFEKNPFLTFVDNYKGFRDYFKQTIFDIYHIHFDNIIDDFKLLNRTIVEVQDLFEKLKDQKYHIICSANDPVVLLPVVKENFPEDKITIVDEGCHLLGLMKADVVANILYEKIENIQISASKV